MSEAHATYHSASIVLAEYNTQESWTFQTDYCEHVLHGHEIHIALEASEKGEVIARQVIVQAVT